jgi:hypothetical protein
MSDTLREIESIINRAIFSESREAAFALKDSAVAAIEQIESERDEARREIERLKAEAELYAGWSRWKDGIWRISHPDSGPLAEWIAEDLQSMKGAE